MKFQWQSSLALLVTALLGWILGHGEPLHQSAPPGWAVAVDPCLVMPVRRSPAVTPVCGVRRVDEASVTRTGSGSPVHRSVTGSLGLGGTAEWPVQSIAGPPVRRGHPGPPVRRGHPGLPVRRRQPGPPVRRRQPGPPVWRGQPRPPVRRGQPGPPVRRGQPGSPVRRRQSGPPVRRGAVRGCLTWAQYAWDYISH